MDLEKMAGLEAQGTCSGIGFRKKKGLEWASRRVGSSYIFSISEQVNQPQSSGLCKPL